MSGPDYLEYKSPCKTYALAVSGLSGDSSTSAHTRQLDHSLAPFPSNLRLAVGSYSETSSENNITVIGLAPSLLHDAESHFCSGGDAGPSDFVPLAKAKTPYPVTKVEFAPPSLTGKLHGYNAAGLNNREILATTSDCLRLWDFVAPDEATQSPTAGFVGRQQSRSGSLVERSALSNSKSDYTAPLTSFCWSTIQPSSVITSSIDTTCTIWDISTNQAITQLISHDREVFDVAWAPNSKDIFASVGADGSVRSFDLRQLDHSTILYESPSVDGSRLRGSPLLRLAFNPTDPNSVAVIHADSPVVTILDVRSPGLAVAELRSHASAVNGIAWQGGLSGSGSPVNGYADYAETGSALLASVSDDCQVLLWDLHHPNTQAGAKQALPRQYGLANSASSTPAPIDNVVWGSGREYIGIAMGNTVRCMRV